MLLLPCWLRSPALAGDDWLKHTYTLAVSKLEATFSGRICRTVSYNEMSPRQKAKSVHSISEMRNVIEGFLLYPTRAVQRFHQGSSLLEHWDIFNLKPVDPVLAEDEYSSDNITSRTRGKRQPESPKVKPAAKKSKVRPATEPVANTNSESQQWEQAKLVLEDEFKQIGAALKDSKLQLSEKVSLIAKQNTALQGAEVKHEVSKAQILALQQEVKVRNELVCHPNILCV